MIEAVMTYDFLQYAFISGLLIGLIAPLLGVFIVVRRLSLIADALSHVTLAGIAASLYISQTVAFFASWNPLFLGMGASIGGSLLIERLRRLYKSYEELAIPIIMSAGLGFGAIFISLSNGFSTDLFAYLFGSISAVSFQDLVIVIAVTILVGLFIILLYKELFVLSFDEEHAKTAGIPAKFLHVVFMILTALVIAASMRIVGILLVSSLITLPVATSLRVAKSFKQTILYAILFGESSVIIGMFSSFHLDLAPGGTIVVTSILLLIIVLLLKKGKGMLLIALAGGCRNE
ncbi:metal ABC transporter permease [Paenisporosarcina cavernae]|uniref:Metal ABC transporter permease n=1 Tax=Paenisporosarcina cavernae TaxID=2320858 RepID=A0A385YVJ6_9BACL|nr:metal ABC transporter permease [Paenisporosarcina cavernae]AYC29592.1 metal ABC transporter permease [Paenisporosarcina cavernae]